MATASISDMINLIKSFLLLKEHYIPLSIRATKPWFKLLLVISVNTLNVFKLCEFHVTVFVD